MRFIRWIKSFQQRYPDLPMWLLIIWFVVTIIKEVLR